MNIDKALGAFIGLAVGDAIGAPAEFCQRGRFQPLTGMRAGGKFQMQLGEWTDDTAMALCIADSLIACDGFDPKDQMERYWRWGNEGYNSTRSRAFGVGKTVAKAMAHYKRTGDPYAGSVDPRTAGNGSIMRLAPVILFYNAKYEEAIHYAAESSRTTHQAPEAIECCKILGHILHTAINKEIDKSSLFDNLPQVELTPTLQAMCNREYINKDEAKIKGSGYVVETLEAALWAFETTNSFADAVLKAANLGDDSDTTAAVCGQIAGAYYGLSAIQTDWLNVLFEYPRIKKTALNLIQNDIDEGV